MALRALQGPTGGGSPVGGGGTSSPSTIPRWTGPSTLGDSGLIDDGSVIYTTARNAAFGSTSSAGYRARVLAAAGAGSAFGLRIDAGTNSTDYALRIANQATTSDYLAVRGDGNVGIGTASPASYISASSTVLAVASPGGNLGTVRVSNTSSFASGNQAEFFASTTGVGLWGSTNCPMVFYTNSTERARIDSSGNLILNTANTGATIQAAGSQQGLKLPATPGNADTQTLDAYRENTFTTTTSGATNCSSITLSNLRYTQIGRLVTIEGTASFTVTAATTATSFYFTLPSGCNRGSTANVGAGLAVDNATGYSGALWNLAGTNNDVFLFFNASNPFGAGTSRTVPFSYSYYTASS